MAFLVKMMDLGKVKFFMLMSQFGEAILDGLEKA